MISNCQLQLEEALCELTRRLLDKEALSKPVLLKSLLLHIDADFFDNCQIEASDIRTYSKITKRIGEYYHLRLGLALKTQLRTKPYESDFLCLFQLAMDMLFTMDKNQVIELIIGLDPVQRELLMPFVNRVTQREFVGHIENEREEEIQSNERQVEQLREVCIELTKKCEDLQEKCRDLEKAQKNTNEIIRQYQFERVEILNELGVSSHISYEELVARLKAERQEFEAEKARLNEDFHDRTVVLSSKEIQISQMMRSASLKRQAKQTVGLEVLERKNKELNAQVNDVTNKYQRLKSNHTDVCQKLASMTEENSLLFKEIENNRKIVEKWTKMKNLHAQFKSNLQKTSDRERQI